MTTLALLLVVVAAFAHATWNLLSKQAGGGPTFVWIYSTVAAALYAPLTAAVFFFQPRHVGVLEVSFVVGSAILHLGYFVLLQYSYRLGDLSLIYPLARGSGSVLSTATAILVFRERPGWLALCGAFLVVMSILLFAGPARSDRSRKDFSFGVLTGVFIAAYTLWDKHAVSALRISPVLMAWGTVLGLSLMLSPAALRDRDAVRRQWALHRKQAVGIGLLSPLAYILILTALVFTPVSYIAPARELSILVGAVMGARLLAEGHPRRRLTASSMMVVGLIALALG